MTKLNARSLCCVGNSSVVELRYPSFKGIMAAKNKPVEELDLDALGIEAGTAG